MRIHCCSEIGLAWGETDHDYSRENGDVIEILKEFSAMGMEVLVWRFNCFIVLGDILNMQICFQACHLFVSDEDEQIQKLGLN